MQVFLTYILLSLFPVPGRSPPPRIISFGGVLDITETQSGVLVSPTSSSANTFWQIKAAPGKQIKAFLFYLNLGNQRQCPNNNLNILEPNALYPLAKLCGKRATGLVATSTQNVMLVNYQTDGRVPFAGFYLVFIAVDGPVIATSTSTTTTKTTTTSATTSVPSTPTTTVDVAAASFCPAGYQNCPGLPFPCISSQQICDGVYDCPGGTDEQACDVKATCGVPKIQPLLGNKIVGGQEVIPHSWPWLVAMYRGTATSTSYTFICGGTIISNRWILTAAHCCNSTARLPSRFRIRIGAHDLLTASPDPYDRLIELEDIQVHPFYAESPMTLNDFCLLKTKEVIPYSDHVSPACLGSPADGVEGESCIVSGWGTTTAQKSQQTRGAVSRANARVLQQATVNVMNQDRCATAYDGMVTSEMLCAAAPGRDSCQGDSGGPLICQDSVDRMKWKLVGVVSWGTGCAQENYPGVYARVTSASSWISAVTSS